MEISLKSVPKGPISSKIGLAQVMAWHRTGNKSLYELLIVHWRIYASQNLSKLAKTYHKIKISEYAPENMKNGSFDIVNFVNVYSGGLSYHLH